MNEEAIPWLIMGNHGITWDNMGRQRESRRKHLETLAIRLKIQCFLLKILEIVCSQFVPALV
jgi:hypothetical protein